MARHDDEIYELGWHRRRGIEAYASRTSLTAGETLNVHVSTYPVNQWPSHWRKKGYDVTYISNVDTHADGSGLGRAKVFSRSATTSTEPSGCSST